MVVVEQSAETRTAFDRARSAVIVARQHRRSDELATDALVLALAQIVLDELLDQVA